ncbi:branched-subunit amino acid aminotransferase/4-amino-4-deoxychorismate lyase [Rhizobium pisi]|nr:branched-subunit amino acid aminotransferase/4-amino-4-deoxychorismate lyase [Rhizobium pisi]
MASILAQANRINGRASGSTFPNTAEAKGYADAMMLDDRDLVAEATGANIFFVRDGVIHTPIPDYFPNRITRQRRLEGSYPAAVAAG